MRESAEQMPRLTQTALLSVCTRYDVGERISLMTLRIGTRIWECGGWRTSNWGEEDGEEAEEDI